MTQLWLIVVSTVLVNNLVLTRFLGLCPMMGSTRSVSSAVAMSFATTFVLTLTAGLTWLVQYFILAPFGMTHLRLLAFILVIAALVKFTDYMIRELDPMLHRVLGLYLPLITSNCAILGVALLNVFEARTFAQSLAYGLGASLGFALVLIIFAGARERLNAADVPYAFRGPGIALVTAGILSLAFMGFAGFGDT